MSRWFRHYTGMVRDPKFVGIAARCRQPLERVVFVWGWILESASDRDQKGVYSADADEIAYTLRCNAEDVTRILEAMESIAIIEDGIVQKWSKRQFESDTSKDRVARHRAKKRGETQPKRRRNGPVTTGNGDVTLHERDVTVKKTPDTDTELSPVGDSSSVLSDGRTKPADEPVCASILEFRHHADPEVLPPESHHPPDEAAVFRRGKEVLGKGSGGQIKKLWMSLGGDPVQAMAVIEEAAGKGVPSDWFAARIRASAPAPAQRQDPHLKAAQNYMERLHATAH